MRQLQGSIPLRAGHILSRASSTLIILCFHHLDGGSNHIRISIDDAFCLILVKDSSKAESQTPALNESLMAQHPSSVRLPWAIDLIGTMRPIPLSWRAIALIHEFTDTGGNGPILTVYDHFDPLVNWKIHTRYFNLGIGINHFKAVVLRVSVDNVAPAIDANNRNDPLFLSG